MDAQFGFRPIGLCRCFQVTNNVVDPPRRERCRKIYPRIANDLLRRDQCKLDATLLAYKMEERGGQVVTVPARFTSQTCAACGVVDARSRESQARFTCIACGHGGHADTNAAINIERR